MTATLNPPIIERGKAIWVGGFLRLNHCFLSQERLGLFVREAPGPFHFHTSALTGPPPADAGAPAWQTGQYDFRLVPQRSLDLVVIHSATKDISRAVSRVLHITVVPPGGRAVSQSCIEPYLPSGHDQPPDDIELTASSASSAASGSDLVVEVELSNQSRVDYHVDVLGVGASLVRASSGEVVASGFFSGTPKGPGMTIERGESAMWSGMVALRTCQSFLRRGFAIPPGAYELVAVMGVADPQRAGVQWLSSAVSVDVTG